MEWLGGFLLFPGDRHTGAGKCSEEDSQRYALSFEREKALYWEYKNLVETERKGKLRIDEGIVIVKENQTALHWALKSSSLICWGGPMEIARLES